jgi:carboxylate-amine ligase
MTELPDRLVATRPTAWEVSTPLSVEKLRALFDARTVFTIGVEEELMLLDPSTLEIAPESDLALRLVADDDRFAGELRHGQIELRTPVCGNAVAAAIQLADARLRLCDSLDGRLEMAASGTHPFSASWGSVRSERRYRQIAEEYPYAEHAHLPSGFHVHVAVPGADRALAVFNAARSFLPELAALAANSPFLDGRDTGLASARHRLSLATHREGVPPAFRDWKELVSFLEWGRRGGVFPDASHLWWDLRPHLQHGTLELRVADAQTRIDDAAGIAAVYQCLLVWLAARFDDGEQLAVHRQACISENAWRAARYGTNGWMIDLQSGEPVETRQRICELLDDLEPCASRLGTTWALLTARALLADNGADRQRYVAAREGLTGLVAWLAEETVASPREYLERPG